MVFFLFLNLCIVVHLIVMVVLAYSDRNLEKEKKWMYWDVLIIIGITSLFFLFVDSYLDFMWWFTSMFQ